MSAADAAAENGQYVAAAAAAAASSAAGAGAGDTDQTALDMGEGPSSSLLSSGVGI